MKYYLLTITLLLACSLSGQDNMNNQKIEGYKGIWFTLGQFTSEHGDKYSGGAGYLHRQTSTTSDICGGCAKNLFRLWGHYRGG